jgi:curved DNA-binding protein
MGGGFGGFNFGGFGDFTRSEGNTGGFSDFFEQLFGGARRRSQSSRHGQDYEAELNLTLRDVTTTHKQVISIGDKSLRVTIPAGVHDGQRLKLRGHGGEAAEGGTRGDLYITFRIAPDAVFTRQGDDLYTTVPISLTTAVLGGNVALTTLMGETLRLKVSAGTQPDTKVRLKGKGMPVYKKTNERGDLIVTYSLIIPTTLTSEQKELFERLQQLSL